MQAQQGTCKDLASCNTAISSSMASFSVVISSRYFLQDDSFIEPVLFKVARFLQLANSFINPIIYCSRMPEFKRALNALFCRGERARIQENQTFSEINAVVLARIRNLDFTSVNQNNNKNCRVMSSL